MLNINDTQQYSGIDQRFFNPKLASIVKDMCKNNKAATKFIHMLRYIYVNSVDNEFTRVGEISTSVPKEKTRDGHRVSYSERFGTFEFKLTKKEYSISKIK